MTCQITSDCPNPCEGTTYGCASCNHAKRRAEREAAKVKVRKPIKKVSDHRAEQLREYAKLRKEYLALYPVCEVEDCNLKSVDIHHQAGKEGERLLDTNYFFAVCRGHHEHFTEHSKEAIELGISVLRTTVKLKLNPTSEVFILEAGEYYRINNTKKILYWNGEQWMKPIKDRQKRFGNYVANLDKQPKVKSVELVSIDKIPY